MIKLEAITVCQYNAVKKYLNWESHRNEIEDNLSIDLDIDSWDEPDVPIQLIREFSCDYEKYITKAFEFLKYMNNKINGLEFYSTGLPQTYKIDLLFRERAYYIAQLIEIFFMRNGNSHWCLQIFENDEITLIDQNVWFPWDENCFVIGFNHSEELNYFSPAIIKLDFNDNIKIPRNGQTLFLRNRRRKLSVIVNNKNGVSHSLTQAEYARFAPSMDWMDCLYRGFVVNDLLADDRVTVAPTP